MFERAVQRYRLLNSPGVPEESRNFRVAVLATVLLSVVAAVVNGAVGLEVGIPVILGVIAGSYYSWRYRTRSNLLLKFILTILLLVVFGLFWSELSGSIFDLRYPLVRLFLWLQVLHSFDLPTRRDLDFSLISATILMAFAGSLSLTTGFLYLLIPFFAVGLVALYLGNLSAIQTSSDVFVRGRGRSRSPRRAVLVTAVVVLPVTLLFFIGLPRLPGFSTFYLPVSYLKQLPGSFEGLIRNPGYKEMPDHFPSTPMPFNPRQYAGFSKFLDLRVRGVPEDVTVMKVRCAEPSYWRATAFDTFLGNGWENTDETFEDIYSNQLPLTIGYPREPPRYAIRDLVQTFFIEAKLPNTMFASFLPRDVFFPTRALKVDSQMTVMTPVTLDPGLIYTVVSEVSNASPDMLRSAVGNYPKEIRQRFLQLPEMPENVTALAREITFDKTNDYDRVMALSEYLKTHYEYDLEAPPQGNDENSVEHFLFEEKRGNCEQFASSLAVMCRELLIPARIAVGYSTGELNPLTGYYEVAAIDAHAWVEVYFPIYGWISFDPTPGWEQPHGRSARDATWSGLSFFSYIGKALSRVFPAGWGRAIKGAFTSAAGGIAAAARAVAGAVADHWRGIVVAAVLFLLAVWLAVGLRAWRRRRRDEEPPGGPRQLGLRIFTRMASLLAGAGFMRRPSQTPIEYAAAAAEGLDLPAVEDAARLFTRIRFAVGEPEPEDLVRLDNMVDEIEADLALQERREGTRLLDRLRRRRPG